MPSPVCLLNRNVRGSEWSELINLLSTHVLFRDIDETVSTPGDMTFPGSTYSILLCELSEERVKHVLLKNRKPVIIVGFEQMEEMQLRYRMEYLEEIIILGYQERRDVLESILGLICPNPLDFTFSSRWVLLLMSHGANFPDNVGFIIEEEFQSLREMLQSPPEKFQALDSLWYQEIQDFWKEDAICD
ncbi:hypothetical protein NEOLI_004927 [Neolecta irregularis DAH-3]|uniref:Uncharacterized protein n=1 Tax=Neolecta irregularis (strain DAH-3) TaxID=1198029 RepID=A0A1U7LKV1_NEOID|nr:hypothetical protein NEOLI_004927 [Neolecta irregularis DAH-3]|eukprot:OLL23223.1 hypothetical protein NEOLI_004927 [Neolecta irregularis DAH-3]